MYIHKVLEFKKILRLKKITYSYHNPCIQIKMSVLIRSDLNSWQLINKRECPCERKIF